MRFLILFLALFAILAFAQDDAPADDAPAAPDAADAPPADDPPSAPDASPADEPPAAPDAPATDNTETPTANAPNPETPGGDTPTVNTTGTDSSTVNAPSNDTPSAPTTPNSDAPSNVPSTGGPSNEAPIVMNNPIGRQYIAMLPNRTDTTVRGAVAVNTNSNGTGGVVQVSISGLPAMGGPFSKYFHVLLRVCDPELMIPPQCITSINSPSLA